MRRWALGEVMSQFFHEQSNTYKQETLSFLRSKNEYEISEGIRRHQLTRGLLISLIPKETKWYLAKLPVTESELSKLYTIRGTGWERYSGGTFKLSDTSAFIQRNPTEDMRVAAIISGLEVGIFEPTGITLIGRAETGPYQILEGNGRLVSIYIQSVFRNEMSNWLSGIDVVLGHVHG